VSVGATVTVNVTPLLARPPTVTTTLPDVAPAGTGATMLVADQLVGVAVVPLNFTVLAPCVAPKFVPVIVTEVPTGPDVVDKLVIVGVIVKMEPLLSTPLAWTTTFPVVAPVGTGITIDVALQVPPGAKVPLKETVLVPLVDPKLVPVIVTDVPTTPEVGERLVMFGGATTVNDLPLLPTPLSATTTLPVPAPAGTVATIDVGLQLVIDVATVVLNFTVLVPCVAPKFEPAIVTEAPIAPVVGVRLVMLGVGTTVKVEMLLSTPLA